MSDKKSLDRTRDDFKMKQNFINTNFVISASGDTVTSPKCSNVFFRYLRSSVYKNVCETNFVCAIQFYYKHFFQLLSVFTVRYEKLHSLSSLLSSFENHMKTCLEKVV